VTDNLLRNYQHIIEQLTLITGSGGAFEVKIDGELVFSKKALKRHAEPGEILGLFEEIIGPEVTPYPQ
jgi:selT/selW/selH-like putative selenoprotein